MEVIGGILGAFGLSASAGLNAYIPLLVVALLAKFTPLLNLNGRWEALTSWWTIGILGGLAIIEFVADKIPVVDHANDVLQTFIRPIAGAIVFAASTNAVTEVNPVLSLVAGLFVAGSIHTVKSVAVRPLVTASTGGAGDPVVSTIEDILATLVSVLSVVMPILMLIVLILVTWWVVTWIGNRKRAKAIIQS